MKNKSKKIASTQIEDKKLTSKQKHTNMPFSVWSSNILLSTKIEDLNMQQLQVALYSAIKRIDNLEGISNCILSLADSAFCD